MKVLAEVAIVPIGAGASISDFVATCKMVFDDCKLENELHAHGTNVEGEWEEIISAVQRCHETLHGIGVPRISTRLQLETRVDGDPSLTAKVSSVEEKLP